MYISRLHSAAEQIGCNSPRRRATLHPARDRVVRPQRLCFRVSGTQTVRALTCSKLIAQRDPIVPILNRLFRLLIGLADRLQLR